MSPPLSLDSTRVIDIQCVMADRCVQLLDLDDNASLILDIGCGSGLSGDVLDEYGYAWVGMDISKDMLGMYSISKREYFLWNWKAPFFPY